MKLAIVGGGAIGLSFAAVLAGVHDVVVLVRRESVADAIVRHGIAVVGDEEEFVPVTATADPLRLGDRDAVIVAVKAFATGDALAPLRGVLAPNTLVVSVQNGVGNVEVARSVLPESRVVGGSTMYGAIRLGDGRVRPVVNGETIFERDTAASPTSDELAEAFAAAGLAARVVDDIRPVLWGKLVVNAAINPVGALARRPNGAIATDPDLIPVARALAQEAGTVAAALGIEIADPWTIAEAAAHATAANRNSMLQDLDAGRPTEIDAISGAVARAAAERAIPIPITETVLRLVRARERG